MARVVLTDIEGTIADIAFVRKVLFPYAREALPGFVSSHGDEPAVATALAAAAEMAGLNADDREAIVGELQRWIDEDRKLTPLKALQGMIWNDGYARGEFRAHLYPDAHAALARWHQAGIPLYVYSSGSVQAQKLYFAHTDYGDILDWFFDFFDTTVGGKKEAASYREILQRIGAQGSEVLFLSDVVAELDAAADAGLKTLQICRPGTEAGDRHPVQAELTGEEIRTA